MAAATINQIRLGLETRLKTVTGLRVTEYVPDQVNPPQAVVMIPPVTAYHSTMGQGRYELAPIVMVFTSAAIDRVGQDRLSEYADISGTKSIRAAVEGDRTLGGVVDDCVVMEFRPIGVDEFSVIGYYGGLWTLKCIAPGV